MSFKDNLIKKIRIDTLSKKAIASIGTPDSGRKIDKKIISNLLEMASYTLKKERDLELFLSPVEQAKRKILVLDNELAIYNTTVQDVVLRKSPYVKEMLNIRNVIKILNDSDVLISKRDISIKSIQEECIEKLNLSFKDSDIDSIAKDGMASLKKEAVDGVLEAVTFFSEILDYTSLPQNVIYINHTRIIGSLIKDTTGDTYYSPVIIYGIADNAIRLIDSRINIKDKEQIEFIRNVAAGKKPATLEGESVFLCLSKYCKILTK